MGAACFTLSQPTHGNAQDLLNKEAVDVVSGGGGWYER